MPTYYFKEEKFFPKSINKNTETRKRYLLTLDIKGEKKGNETYLVILKNPSRAGEEVISISDCTINRVGEYFYQNLRHVKEVIIMNLFPVYETNSEKLLDRKNELIDQMNKYLLKEKISKANHIVLAWGGHPDNCYYEFEEMKKFVLSLLKDKKVYQMKHPKWGLNLKKPLHGQVWGYKYELEEIKI